MNPAVEKFMVAVKDCGYTQEEIRAEVRNAALDVIRNLYNRECYSLKDSMYEMSFQELLAIAAEMKEGGNP